MKRKYEIKFEKDNIFISRNFRCEPTYEELKQHSQLLFHFLPWGLRAYLWGIETHFSLLFLTFLLPLRAYLWGIETKMEKGIVSEIKTCCEPTYEELKLEKWIILKIKK